MINSTLQNNGRINILNHVDDQFNFADKIPIKETSNYNSALRGMWNDTPLSILFFSKENIELLQTSIKKGVYEKSNQQYVIGNQNEDELKIIMRSIFLQNAHNLPYDITKQIKELNTLVLKYAVKQIYEAAISYMKYKQDVSNPLIISSHPVNASNKGNTLELKPFV